MEIERGKDERERENEREIERERGRTRTMEPSSKREATTPKQPPRYQPPYQHQSSSFQTPPTYTQSIGSEACLGRRFPHERPMKVPLFEKKNMNDNITSDNDDWN